MQSKQLTNNKLHAYKSLCIHWQKLPNTFTLPPLKQNYYWISLENNQIIQKPINKDFLISQVNHNRNLKQCNLFINKHSLAIQCVTCKKQIFDIYSKYSSPDDLLLIQKYKITPFDIRSLFIKPYNEQTMFSSNLEYPKSFQKQKRNCSILISQNRNTFIQTVIRFMSSIQTIVSLAQSINVQKLKSSTLQYLFNLILTMNTGKYRILKINEFEEVFFSQYPQFLSYQNRKPISVIFKLFSLVQSQFNWIDSYCKQKQIVNYVRTQWSLGKNSSKYSILRQMLLSKFTNIEVCPKCENILKDDNISKQFQCLKLEPITLNLNSFSNSFTKRKSIELNILKAIQSTLNVELSSQQLYQIKPTSYCERCSNDMEYQIKAVIQPGNYLLFQIQSKQNIKMILPKEVNLNNLDKKKFIVNQNNPTFQFIAAIYKDSQDKSIFAQQFGSILYHKQNKKYINFFEQKVTQHDSLNLQKCFTTIIYKRKLNQQNIPIVKNIKSMIYLIQQKQLIVQNPIPLPDFYDIYLSQHFKIPPLLNPFFCHHSKLSQKVQNLSKCRKVNYLPIEIYNYLVDTFGGRKINQNTLKNLQKQCNICLQGLQTLKQIKSIQKQVMKYVDNFSVKKGQVLVYKPWLQNWKSYLYEGSKQNYNLWGNPLPSPINNCLGMIQNNPKTLDFSKYTKISYEVWLALSMFYSGGPQITIKKIVKNNSNNQNYYILSQENVYQTIGKKIMKVFEFESKVIMEEDESDIIDNNKQIDSQNQELQQKGKQLSQQKSKQRRGLFSRQKTRSLIKQKNI